VNPIDETVGIALLKRIATKDRKAFEEFYYLYAQNFGRFFMKLLKNEDWVDEAINDFMLTVWQQAERYEPEKGRLSTWLFGIAHNKGLKVLERYRRHKMESLDDDSGEFDSEEDEGNNNEKTGRSGGSNPERTVMGWQLGDAMAWAFDKLSPDHQTVIELCFAEDFTYQEIADITGCPINTVKTRLFHARKRMAELLAKKGFKLAASEEVFL
jgi:RNA polymerase sigma-70 factor, ECF subfamily